MEEIESRFIEDFDVEIGDFDIESVNKFDRLQRASEGGSITSRVTYYNGLVYFTSANHNVYCVKPDNGELVWKFRTEAIIMESSPIPDEGLIYVASFDHNLYCIDAEKGTLVWKFKTGDKITTTAAVSDDLVYIGSSDNMFYALNKKTGEVAWKFRTFGWVNSNSLVVDDKIYFGSYDRFVYCLDKNDGHLIWKLETQGEIFNTTAFGYHDGVMYVPSMDGILRAIDAETGRLLWKLKLATYGMASSAIVHNDTVLQTTRDGILFALTFEGKIKWKYKAGEEDVLGVPVVHDGKIYVGSYSDYNLHCISLEGKLIWKFKTMHGLYEGSVLVGNMIIFGGWDCIVYCIDKDTAKVYWKYKVGGAPVDLPPPHEHFELNVSISEEDFEETQRKTYDFDALEKERDTSEYKSEITYQAGTTYREKGKYQIDSREEEF